MRLLDFGSWQGLLLTLIGLALFTLISMGIRVLMMLTIQQRRERVNRQINERLRTLMAAYKTLGGSFTGDLTVDPRHLRDLRRAGPPTASDTVGSVDLATTGDSTSGRSRRIRDAVEASLSDVILLGTEEQVRLAEHAARQLVAGRPVRTHELVVSLRDYIRGALDLAPIPPDLEIPMQGPTRPAGSPARAKGERVGEGAREGGRGEAIAGGGMGMGMGMGLGMGAGDPSDDHS